MTLSTQWVSVIAFLGALLALCKVPVETRHVKHLNFDQGGSDDEEEQECQSLLAPKNPTAAYNGNMS